MKWHYFLVHLTGWAGTADRVAMGDRLEVFSGGTGGRVLLPPR